MNVFVKEKGGRHPRNVMLKLARPLYSITSQEMGMLVCCNQNNEDLAKQGQMDNLKKISLYLELISFDLLK